MTIKWEYRADAHPGNQDMKAAEAWLNSFGALGWVMCGQAWGRFIFARPLQEIEKQSTSRIAYWPKSIESQKREFDTLGELLERYRQLPPVVDDSYPQARYAYEKALVAFIEALRANGRFNALSSQSLNNSLEAQTGEEYAPIKQPSAPGDIWTDGKGTMVDVPAIMKENEALRASEAQAWKQAKQSDHDAASYVKQVFELTHEVGQHEERRKGLVQNVTDLRDDLLSLQTTLTDMKYERDLARTTLESVTKALQAEVDVVLKERNALVTELIECKKDKDSMCGNIKTSLGELLRQL